MIKPSETAEIKKLIQKFDLDLISFELDIPMEDLKQVKAEMEKEKKILVAQRQVAANENKYVQAHSKLKQMREKYRRLFSEKRKEFADQHEQREEDVKLINSVIESIQKLAGRIKEKGSSEKDKYVYINTVINKLNKIQSFKLTLEQAEKLDEIMQLKELQGLKGINDSIIRVNNPLKQKGRAVGNSLIHAMKYARNQTEDIEQLKALRIKITPDMEHRNIQAAAERIALDQKIAELEQRKRMEEFRNNIPESILQIARSVVNGEIDIKKANAIIGKEAKRRVDSKPKTRFSLTEEQEKRQILIQIRTAISERVDQYPINNPEDIVEQLAKLCAGDYHSAVNTVIENLITGKKYEEAMNICNKFYGKNGRIHNQMQIKNTRAKIKNAEFADIVLEALKTEGTEVEELAYYEFIEKGLNQGNINPRAISLGKSQDGRKNITLSDVWTEQKQR